MESEVLRSTSQELRERMMAKKREIEEEFYSPEANEADDLVS